MKRSAKDGGWDRRESSRFWPRWITRVCRRLFCHSDQSSTIIRSAKGRFRRCAVEPMEPRALLSAVPLQFGTVYVEEDLGSDLHGDSFYVTFEGGAPDTELTRLVINGDQDQPGLSKGDVLFDTVESGVGADHALPFTLVSWSAADPNATVTSTVLDGESTLVLDLAGFQAGDRLVFTIDVDEIEDLSSTASTPIDNDGLDPITSGLEFQGSQITAHFSAPHYYDVSGTAEFRNRYDTAFAGLPLDLPADDEGGKRDRSAGAAIQLQQEPLPVSLAGTVFLDNDLDLTQSSGEPGIAGVTIELWSQDGSQPQFTGLTAITDVDGHYAFGADLALPPGVYRLVERQPDELFSVGAVLGTVDGQPSGESTDDPNEFREIALRLGGQHAADYDFAEAQPAAVEGFVYHDRNDNGAREAGEEGIAGIEIQVVPNTTIANQSTVSVTTDADGHYQAIGLAPGQYSIVQPSQPVGYLDGQDSAGTVSGVPRGIAQPAADQITGLRLDGGQRGVEFNFGEILPGRISGMVRLSSADGDCKSGANPLAGVTVQLFDARGQILRETTTDSAGQYEFRGLAPGSYGIVEVTPDGLIDGSDHVGRVAGHTAGVITANDTISGIVLGSGEQGQDYDFCEHLPSRLSGYVFHDQNDNGQFDNGEQPLAGVAITLTDEHGQVVGQQRTTTDGSYAFTGLRAGVYTIAELQPGGWLTGRNAVGRVDGQTRGTWEPGSDRFTDIVLRWGETGARYDFGELLPARLSGRTHEDRTVNCELDEGESPLGGVSVQLFDASNSLVASTRTDSQGNYVFEDLRPGVYRVVEVQPSGWFDGQASVGSHGGELAGANVIGGIVIASGDELTGYDFCDLPAASLSGFVFQDGPALVTDDGSVPENVAQLRDGQFTSDDVPLAGVVLELRDGLTGRPIDGKEALPGTYGGGPIRAVTDASGFYEFRGLPGGRSYAVYEIQPEGFIDGIDTPGTTSGLAINPHEPISPLVVMQLVVDPGTDAILRIPLPHGGRSEENNFSEVRVERRLPPFLPPRITPPPFLPPVIVPDLLAPAAAPVGVPLAAPSPILIDGGSGHIGGSQGVTWHLSVVDGGRPRNVAAASGRTMWLPANYLETTQWQPDRFQNAQWVVFAGNDQQRDEEKWEESMFTYRFGVPEAIPVAGDFNGDGISELGVYYQGEWFLDLNGNGVWDEEDLWARLGSSEDLPVVGDWNGDGKDDIGIFGPEWAGDPRALEREPGLPDVFNAQRRELKNVPPDPQEATEGERVMQWQRAGMTRADLIDHVFRFGSDGDQPVAGDFNGDGIATIGVFRDGQWRLDLDGDGRWTQADATRQFGEAGDRAVVGDWNGDGVDELGVFRNGTWLLDSNGNGHEDAHDRVFAMGESNDLPVAGDWNGDGVDEPGIYREDAGPAPQAD